MNEYLRTFLKTGVVLFCLWHMAAVATYALPRETTFLKHVRPYMLLTSQWQKWDLFSPDPLRRIEFYSIDTVTDGEPTRFAIINDDAYGPLRHAARFKLLGRIFSENPDHDVTALEQHAALILCQELKIATNQHIYVLRDTAIIPRTPPADWSTWSPTFERTLLVSAVCAS